MNLMQIIFFTFFLLVFVIKTDNGLRAEKSRSNVLEDITDNKEFKKLLRSKTNILICFVSGPESKTSNVVKAFREAADIIKGHGTMVIIQCVGSARKLCRTLKINEDIPFQIKHYKNGDFHKDYDRKLAAPSFVNFVRDPSGGIPWEEEPTSVDVIHLSGYESFSRFLKKGSVLNRPLLVVFYAPWCSYCSTLKPEIAAVATDLKGKAFIAAFDTAKSENLGIAHQFNITILPTLLYFENGKFKFPYEGDNTRTAIFDFMVDPQPSHKHLLKPNIVKEKDWALTDSDVLHLTSDTFDPLLKSETSALVVFHAPWCGHCKNIKPEYEKAASVMKDRGIPGLLAAVDATKEPDIASKLGIKGYPTLKYFTNGEYQFDISLREESKIIEFMKDPKEPAPPPPQEPMWPEQSPVVLLHGENFRSTLKKKKHALVMFYAPWCGHCKKLKPDFDKVAETFSDESRILIAAVDCTEQPSLCNEYSVKGYPTLKYFSYFDKLKQDYTGVRTFEEMVKFLHDPTALIAKPISQSLLTNYQAEVMALTDSNFKSSISSSKPTMVMFYAPWCGHCTATKPAFEEASKQMEAENIPALLRILDSTENPATSSLYKIVSFPTFKVFHEGNFVIDYKGDRTKDDFVDFMRNFLKLLKTEL